MKIISTIFLIVFITSCSDDDIVKPIDPPPPPSGAYEIDFMPSWSPDGHTIAFYRRDSTYETTGIYLIDTNGTNERLLIGDMSFSPDFSPDGNWITYANGQIFKIKINGDSLTELTNAGNNRFPSWSSDGNWISYDSDFNDPNGTYFTWIIRADGSDARRIGRVVYADWYSNNIFLLGVGLFDEFYRVNNYDTSKMKLTNLSQSNPYYFDNRYPKISPTDSKIIFSSQHKQAVNFQIFEVNIDGTNLIRLTTTQGYSPAWSPDGEMIIYCDPSPGNGRLWIMNKDGTNKRQLTF